jgi:leader peptidase (prepilin peptidase) / N-methyltransferase
MLLGSLAEAYAWFPVGILRGFVLFFGLIWGSFLNVVIYRVPREMSVVRPASHCPGCGKPIAGYDNVPIFSYVLLRGRARCCGARMSPRYPMVELIGGLLSLAIFETVIMKMPGTTPAVRALAVYGADFALCMGLVAAAFIDAEHMFLPDTVTIGGTVLGVATATLRDLPLTDSLLGAVIGFTGVWLPFIFLYKGLLGRTGMGMGDAKLLALAGAWFGWPGAVFALFAGALQGTLYAVVLKVLGVETKLPASVQEDIAELEKAAAEGDEEAKKALEEDPLTENEDDAFILRWLGLSKKADKKEEGTGAASAPDEGAEADVAVPRARIPFGPFLILACLELLLASEWITSRLAPLFSLR